MRNNEELKLLLDNIIPPNVTQNHELFKKIFDIFFEYISDSYVIGSNTNLLLEPDEDNWESRYNNLYHTDLSAIKEEFVKTYLHDINRFLYEMKNNTEIYNYFNEVYSSTTFDKTFSVNDLVKNVTSDDFLIHKVFAQQKTVPSLFNSIMNFVNKMNIPNIHGVDSYLEMYQGTSLNPKKPFSYTVNSSIPRPVYDNAIRPSVHPIGFGQDYKYEARWDLQDFVNLDIKYENWKVYTIEGTSEDNLFFDYRYKSKKIPSCNLTFKSNGELTQFDVDYPNMISSYGSNLSDVALAGDGNVFVRISENEYILNTDINKQYNSTFNNTVIVNGDGSGNYVEYDEQTYLLENKVEGHGGLISTNGIILVDGEVVEGVKVENDKVLTLENDVWSIDDTFQIIDGFIFKTDIRDLFNEQAAYLTNYNSNIIVQDNITGGKVFNLTGSHSFFLKFDDLNSTKYIWSTNDINNSIMQSMAIDANTVTIYERNSTTLVGSIKLLPNTLYHFVIQWDSAKGRRLFINAKEVFLLDNSVYRPEKVLFKTVQDGWVYDGEYKVDINYKTFSLTYDILYTYEQTKTINFKYDFFKKGYKLDGVTQIPTNMILLKSLEDTDIVTEVLNILSDNQELLDTQKQLIMNEYNNRKIDMSEMEALIELNRINRLFEDSYAITSTASDFTVTINNEIVQWSDFVMEKNENVIKFVFDNILNENNEVFNEYSLVSDISNFKYYPDVDKIVIGNTLYHTENGINRVGYVVDNYDIFSRVLTEPEITELYSNHDTWIANDKTEDLEIVWSLDQAIWDNYHDELEYSRPTLWDIGETFTIGMENLLIKYYIASAPAGFLYDCTIDKYVDHPKALVDYSVMYHEDAVVWENVEYVSEYTNELDELYIYAQLVDGTRLEYVKDKYLRHIKKYLSDVEGNEYPLDINVTNKTILVDEFDNKVYTKKIINYIIEDEFIANSDKLTRTIGTWETLLDFNAQVDRFKIETARPLILMYATFVLQDPDLVSDPETIVYKIDGATQILGLQTTLEMQGKVVYDVFVTLEFLAEYTDPNIKRAIWDNATTEVLFDIFYESIAEIGIPISIDSNYYILVNDIPVNISALQAQSLKNKTIMLLSDGTEVFFKEDLIKDYPSNSYLDYSYDIKIESISRDEHEYVVELVLGDSNVVDEGSTFCDKTDDGRIYINMDTTEYDFVVPSTDICDVFHELDDELNIVYSGNGIGVMIDELTDLGIVILDFSKTLDLSQYKFSVGILGRKELVSNSTFLDIDKEVKTLNENNIYFSIPDLEDDLESRYQRKVVQSLRNYYIVDDERVYIADEDMYKVRTLLNGSTTKYTDVTGYVTESISSQMYETVLAPTFVGFANILGATEVTNYLKSELETYYVTTEPTYETEVLEYIDILNPGYWVDRDGHNIEIDTNKEFIYYYDGQYKIPLGIDISTNNDSLYIEINGSIELVHYDELSDKYYYIDGSNGSVVMLTDLEVSTIYFHYVAPSGLSIRIPKFPTVTPDENTEYFVEAGGSRLWLKNVTKEEGFYYYVYNSNSTPTQVRLTDIEESQIYTIGGSGIKEDIMQFEVITPDAYQYFYFDDSLWNDSDNEHQRIFLTTEQKTTIVNGYATVQITDVNGAILDKTVKVYLPKYYVDQNNNTVNIYELDYRNIFVINDKEYIETVIKVPADEEQYIKLLDTYTTNVYSYPDNPYYIDIYGDTIIIEELENVYTYNGDYTINVPMVLHKHIMLDDMNGIWYYLNEDGSKNYINKTQYEYYSKSFLSSATKLLDIPYRKIYEVYQENRIVSEYTNSDGIVVYVDENGFEYMSPLYNRMVYETFDGREYYTYYDDLGRYYFDENTDKVYVTKYDKYYYHEPDNNWFKMYYINDELYVARLDIIPATTDLLTGIGYTVSGNILYHSV